MKAQKVHTIVLVLASLMIMVVGQAGATDEAPPSVAIFDFEFIDSSLEGEMKGERPDEQRRLMLISDQLRRMVGESKRVIVIDHRPAQAEIDDAGHLRACNGCAAKIADGLGADLAMTGTVQKVSNLILNINVYVHNAKNNALLAVTSVDIRGNNDKSWQRGLSYLVRNRLLKD